MSDWPSTASRTGSLTRISPPSACPATRAAIATLRPKRSSPASDGGTHVSADAHPDVVPLLSALVQGLLHGDTAAHSLSGIGEGDHESVAFALDHVAVVIFNALVDEFVVPVEQLDPVVDRPTPRCARWNPRYPRRPSRLGRRRVSLGEIGPFDLGPAREVLDRIAHCGADTLVDQRVGRLPGRPDGERRDTEASAAGPVLSAALERAPCPLQLPPRNDQQNSERDDAG